MEWVLYKYLTIIVINVLKRRHHFYLPTIDFLVQFDDIFEMLRSQAQRHQVVNNSQQITYTIINQPTQHEVCYNSLFFKPKATNLLLQCADLVGETVEWNRRTPFEVTWYTARFEATLKPRLCDRLGIARPQAVFVDSIKMSGQFVYQLRVNKNTTS